VAKSHKLSEIRQEESTNGALYVRAGRHFYTEDRAILDMPELISAQLDSYKTFIDLKEFFLFLISLKNVSRFILRILKSKLLVLLQKNVVEKISILNHTFV
jgi:DNA-directed RNA polymerase beta subunit